MDKYMATVETNKGTEVVCYLEAHKTVGTLKEVTEWIEKSRLTFNWCEYHTYKLEEVLIVKSTPSSSANFFSPANWSDSHRLSPTGGF